MSPRGHQQCLETFLVTTAEKVCVAGRVLLASKAGDLCGAHFWEPQNCREFGFHCKSMGSYWRILNKGER